jgi:hypothetical protein
MMRSRGISGPVFLRIITSSMSIRESMGFMTSITAVRAVKNIPIIILIRLPFK